MHLKQGIHFLYRNFYFGKQIKSHGTISNFRWKRSLTIIIYTERKLILIFTVILKGFLTFFKALESYLKQILNENLRLKKIAD